MQKIVIRLTVAICALGIGVAASFLVNRCRTPEVTGQEIPAVELKRAREIPAGWKRVDINGKFAFYIPPTMRPEALPLDFDGPAGGFVDTSLMISFSYFAGHSVCTPDTDPKLPGIEISETTIAGKSARVARWQSPESSHPFFMTLCFADIGDGRTRLLLGAFATDARAMLMGREVFDSLEFVSKGGR